ncbi:Uncharacterised protein [Mycobacteroides abscessus subsp. abscessus]|nr:Uncharacterised protein [Mycobacteroides abscessus subsp. abscessus]
MHLGLRRTQIPQTAQCPLAPVDRLRAAVGEVVDLGVGDTGGETRLAVGDRLDARDHGVVAVGADVGERDGQLAQLRRKDVAQHLQRVDLLAGHQNALALREKCREDVRDGLGLAGTGWPLDDNPTVDSELSQHVTLFDIGREREHRVGDEFGGGCRSLPAERRQPIRCLDGRDQLRQTDRHLGARLAQRRQHRVVKAQRRPRSAVA